MDTRSIRFVTQFLEDILPFCGENGNNPFDLSVWTSLDKFGQGWASLDKIGQVWTSLDKFKQVWTKFDSSIYYLHSCSNRFFPQFLEDLLCGERKKSRGKIVDKWVWGLFYMCRPLTQKFRINVDFWINMDINYRSQKKSFVAKTFSGWN